MQNLQDLLELPWMRTVLGLLALLALAWLAGVLVRSVLTRVLRGITVRTAWRWDDALYRRRSFLWLARIVPALIVKYGIKAIPGVSADVEQVVSGLMLSLIALFVVMAINASLSALEDLYAVTPRGREHSIKGYVQLGKIIVWMIGVIVIIASLVGSSPLSLLAGLGAVSAVLLLIFKDTILSVVASVQLASNDMLRVGDWISMPTDDVDGFVIDVALHTVKVQNWDKTVSTVPTWHLISQSYRNWRGMYESGGRRIRRAINIDVNSVRFLDGGEVGHLRRFQLLTGYFERKEQEVGEWNDALGAPGRLRVNQRRLSNLGSFRAYMQAYIDAHPQINHDMLCAVRQLDPGAEGIPLQIYAYTAVTDFGPHENVQSDIFDHLIAILPEFGLRLFQQPTGHDMQVGLAAARAHEAGSASRIASER
ncbi:MAG TPA: mechanosensitive ion channel domain-containing protein [Rhodanobacter sp.]|nr:mechanosensitive ion channel domain-containing protein [Rhodanobacter sp.]